MAMVKNRTAKPTTIEFGQWHSHLIKMNVPQVTITSIIGDSVNNQTRIEITEKLRIWLKNRLKAK